MKTNTGVLTLAVVSLLLGLLGYWLNQRQDKPDAPVLDPSSLRQQLVDRLASGQPIEDPLLRRYQGFLQQEARLALPQAPDLASLIQLFDSREQLRQRNFDAQEQSGLFGEERLMEQWTLRRKGLAEASPAEQAALGEALDIWLAEQPDWFQEAEANGRLISDLQRMAHLPPEARRLAMLERVGPEAQGRLQQLDQDTQHFERQLDGYLGALATMTNPDPQTRQQLLASWFPEQQWRRVAALTRLRQEQLPAQ
ncbi:MAG: lipase secretion chaperone [Aeromonas molluscorum]